MTKLNTKFQTMSIAIPVVLLVLLVVVPTMQHSVGITGINESSNIVQPYAISSHVPCTPSVNKQTYTELESINEQQAKRLATQNGDFQSKIKGYGITFNSIFVEGSFDPSCTVLWKDVNMVYDLTDSNGNYVRHLIVKEDPSLNQVIEVSEQNRAHLSSSNGNSNWSGYEFYYPSASANYSVWETNSSWSVPTVYHPTDAKYNSPYACDENNYPYTYPPSYCDAAVWIGLEDEQGAHNTDLVQGGTDSNMTCTSATNCVMSYSLIYQVLNSPSNTEPVWCSGITVSPGDTITSFINETTRNSSASFSNYTIATQDTSNSNDNGKVCGSGTLAGNNNNMSNPTLADFIVERDTYPNSNVTETLSNFTSVTMSGTMYYNNSYHSIQASANGNHYYRDLMEN